MVCICNCCVFLFGSYFLGCYRIVIFIDEGRFLFGIFGGSFLRVDLDFVVEGRFFLRWFVLDISVGFVMVVVLEVIFRILI